MIEINNKFDVGDEVCAVTVTKGIEKLTIAEVHVIVRPIPFREREDAPIQSVKETVWYYVCSDGRRYEEDQLGLVEDAEISFLKKVQETFDSFFQPEAEERDRKKIVVEDTKTKKET